MKGGISIPSPIINDSSSVDSKLPCVTSIFIRSIASFGLFCGLTSHNGTTAFKLLPLIVTFIGCFVVCCDTPIAAPFVVLPLAFSITS